MMVAGIVTGGCESLTASLCPVTVLCRCDSIINFGEVRKRHDLVA
jgi:hypothetical protein